MAQAYFVPVEALRTTRQARRSWSISSNFGRATLVNVALTMVGLVAAGLVPLIFNVAVGRTYGAATLGPIAVALSLALFLGQIPGTISGAATKFIAESLGARNENRAREVFQFLLVVTAILSMLIGVIVFLLAPLLESAYHLSFSVVAVSAALIPTYTMYLYFKSCYYGFERVRTYLFNEIISDAAFFGVLAAVFLLGATPWLLVPFVLNNAVFTCIAIHDLGPYLRPFHWMDSQARREVGLYALINGTGSAASLGRWSLGAVIAGLFLSHHAVGLLAAAIAITAPLPLLPRAISLVTFALMARLHGAGETASVRDVLQQSTEWLVFLLGIPSGLAIINASAILASVYRPDFVGAALVTQLIIAGAYVTDISRPSIDALSSTSYVRTATLASFLGLGVSLIIWLSFLPIAGIAAAGAGFALGAFVTAGIPAYVACKRLGSNPKVFLRPVLMLAGIAVLSALGPSFSLVASVMFVLGALALYAHLLDALVRTMIALARKPRFVTEGSI